MLADAVSAVGADVCLGSWFSACLCSFLILKVGLIVSSEL